MSLNILIVDDSDVIRAMIARTLRLAKVPVGTLQQAANGREALALLEDEWVDLVLADINMPVMNGAEMIERMRAQPETADVPVIVVSSEGGTGRVKELLKYGVTTWVRKPFTPEEIRDAVVTLTTGTLDTAEQGAQVDAAFAPILETFTFMTPEVVRADELPAAGEDLFTSSLWFTGAISGVLTVSAPTELCVEFAANVLGADPDDPDARLRGADTLGEIANIAAGHLTSVFGPGRQVDLHPPVVSQMNAAEWEWAAASPSARTYIVEGLPMLVTLRLRSVKPS